MIKAIETQWKGYRFRSRLEARWAVFFERIGVEWQYEPQGFQREWPFGEVHKYLPDFRITIGSNAYWVEVKGNKNWLKENFDEIQALHDFGGCLPGFADNGEQDHVPNGLILLGDVPEPKYGVIFFPVLGHRKGVNLYWRALVPDTGMSRLDEIAKFHFGILDTEIPLDGNEEDFGVKIAQTPNAWPHQYKALSVARSARFEYGEAPAWS